jgi:hypothetical protein
VDPPGEGVLAGEARIPGVVERTDILGRVYPANADTRGRHKGRVSVLVLAGGLNWAFQLIHGLIIDSPPREHPFGVRVLNLFHLGDHIGQL